MTTVIDRLLDAINSRDIDALSACFASDFVNVWPVHPARSFTGQDQVRRNWEKNFAARPDITASMATHAWNGDEVWGEWEFVGTEHDGTRYHQKGVIVAVTRGDVITEARFYMEPVDPPQASPKAE